MRKIKTGDDIIVVTGKDKGKMGKVIRFKSDDYVVVENINLVKRHTRQNPRTNAAGGIIDKEMPLHVSNVAIYNRTTEKADKVGFKFLADGKKVRYFKSSGENIDTV
jgi:large subunit ribosomal protein L24